MAYSLYYMAKYPEMQTRVQEEIRSVLGNEEPTMDSLKKVFYFPNLFSSLAILFNLCHQRGTTNEYSCSKYRIETNG